MSSDDKVPVELDIGSVQAVHTGGMMMDDDSPSEDIYEDPFVINRNGSRSYVSEGSASQVERQLVERDYDDGFGYSAMG